MARARFSKVRSLELRCHTEEPDGEETGVATSGCFPYTAHEQAKGDRKTKFWQLKSERNRGCVFS